MLKNILIYIIQEALENGNVVVNFGAMSLRNALSDPNNVAHLLFLQLYECVEDAKVELSHVRVYVQLHLYGQETSLTKRTHSNTNLMFKKLVFERLVTRLCTGAVEERFVLLRKTLLSTLRHITLLTA